MCRLLQHFLYIQLFKTVNKLKKKLLNIWFLEIQNSCEICYSTDWSNSKLSILFSEFFLGHLLNSTLSILDLVLSKVLLFLASATVVPSLTTIASKFGSHSQKGVVLGIFRSLGSLARAFGPMVFALGKYFYLLSLSVWMLYICL